MTTKKTTYTIPGYFPYGEDLYYMLKMLGIGAAITRASGADVRGGKNLDLASDNLGRIIGAAYKLEPIKVLAEESLAKNPAERAGVLAYDMVKAHHEYLGVDSYDVEKICFQIGSAITINNEISDNEQEKILAVLAECLKQDHL